MDTDPTGANLAEVVLTVMGSIASLIGGAFILFCYMVLPQRQHFRHALIINLAISDFINALNNTVSGLYIAIARHDINPGPACIANGFIGQFTVQATDCSILLIAIVTLWNVRQKTYLSEASLMQKILLCSTAWVLPVITSFTALGLGIYVPVDGNWCWIEESPTYMRYVLTHMWRFLVIVCSSGIYIYIYFYLRKRFANLRMMGGSTDKGTFNNHSINRQAREKLVGTELQDTEPIVKRNSDDRTESSVSGSHFYSQEPGAPAGITKSVTIHTQTHTQTSASNGAPAPMDNSLRNTERRIKKTLLLNGYPIAYIILWIPGIANRIAEATGHPTVVLGIMQASTQLVGLANAITYGVNERMLRQLRDHFTHGGSSAATENRVMGTLA